MSDLFTNTWMDKYKDAWNEAEGVSTALGKIGFNSTIGCGFTGENQPRGVIVVENGYAVRSGAYNGEEMQWDLRADEAHWQQWKNRGVGMAALGLAVMSGKLQFATGDFNTMIVKPELARPFVKSFNLMRTVDE